ncbi:hypothetical protein [Macrococcus bovicus]|uniref:Uncharacterized protein n=1 Tax=Macrococcus bovicus TaxID=69968 RepID=A0A4R6BWH8_9STAP|nr:hypothetical protein [Macrococcus bovicus]TDM12678.1 hypothetical protein ERX55_10505 [Macrococcus bovicus]
MKINEFKKQVEELDKAIQVIELADKRVQVQFNNKQVAYVKNELYSMSTGFTEFDRLGNHIKEDIMNLCRLFAATPPEERIEEPKFRLKLCDVFDCAGREYLNYISRLNAFIFDTEVSAWDHKTQFTKREMDLLPEKIKTMISYKILIPEVVE